jgi:hypothetical protein
LGINVPRKITSPTSAGTGNLRPMTLQIGCFNMVSNVIQSGNLVNGKNTLFSWLLFMEKSGLRFSAS